jgi:phage terminase large subunit GpA-like protein
MADGGAPSLIFSTCARSVAPRKPLTVSQWADAERVLSSKGSAEPGRWRTSRNPPLREPMDCLSTRSPAHDVVLKFPIQFGKTEIAVNFLGYTIDHDPGPVMVCLPAEVSMTKWVQQKLQPMIDETPAVLRAMSSMASRDAANTRTFKEFGGGQLYIEHAGTPSRLKSTSVKKLIVDELDEFAAALITGDDPVTMLDGRTSAFQASYKRLYISTPSMQGTSRIEQLWEKSDRRRFHVACPHCGHRQPLVWAGLHWLGDGSSVHYACCDCGGLIEEHSKTGMIAAGEWVPENPESPIRGYHINALYYPIGLGPRWRDLVAQWRDAQNDPAKLKTFVNDRLAETWEDPAMRSVKHNVIQDRAEPYPLRVVPAGASVVTYGVDTQDNRLAVQLLAWGRGHASWTLDYVELAGDPAEPEVWDALAEYLQRPLEHSSGAILRPIAGAIDAGGHRTEEVKNFVRQRRVPRPLCIFGAVPNNAPVLSKGKLVDVTVGGLTDRRGVMIHHVGTVGAKHWLYARLSNDADKQPEARSIHLSSDLPPEYFAGLVSETYNPSKNRFEKRRGGARNEPLDTWIYAYAATHHPEIRLHRWTKADWDAAEARLANQRRAAADLSPAKEDAVPLHVEHPRPAPAPARRPVRPAAADREWSL